MATPVVRESPGVARPDFWGGTGSAITAIFLASFCLQGLHLIEEPMTIIPYMVLLPLMCAVCVIGRWSFTICAPEFAAFIFFAFMAVSALWAADTALAAQKVAGIVLLLLAYCAARSGLSRLPASTIQAGVSRIGVVVLSLGVIYYAVGLRNFSPALTALPDEGTGRELYGAYVDGVMIRMRGLFDSPNNLALACIMLFLFFDASRKGLAKIGAWLSIVCLILTISLTGWIALAAAMAYSAAFRRRIRSLVVGIAAALTIVVGVYAFVPSEVIDTLAQSRIQRVSGGSGRTEIYSYALQKAEERPILGYGLNQSRNLIAHVRAAKSSHNSFIESMLDGGLVGLGLNVLCWFYLVSLASRRGRDDGSPFCMSVVLALFVFSQGNLLTYSEIMVLSFALLCHFLASPVSSLPPVPKTR